jgi:hypothetical protein
LPYDIINIAFREKIVNKKNIGSDGAELRMEDLS